MYRNSNGSTDQMSYRTQARVFLEKSSEYLENGDPSQASANGWGAAVEVLKAMATKRDWEHYSTRSLYDIVDKLVEETGDEELRRLFATASQLDTNFYEDRLSRATIESYIEDVTRFIAKVEHLLDKEPPPWPSKT